MTHLATLLLLLAGCACFSSCDSSQQRKHPSANTAHKDRFEGTSSSLAQSKHDGLFLTTCTITPGAVAVGNRFSLEVKEAFIEQRFSVGAETDKVKLMDSLDVLPKLVIITTSTSNLRSVGLDSAAIESRQLPASFASTTGQHTIILNLLKVQLHREFALRVQVKNEKGVYAERTLTVQPHPTAQPLEESYNSSSAQAQQAGVLLATCAATLPVLETTHFKLRLKEAFIENRFSVGTRTHGVQLLDSGHVLPRLVLVATPDSRLGPAGATWDLTLPGGGQLTGYQEQAKVLTFDLPERDRHQPFTLLLRLRRSPVPDTVYTIQVRPIAVNPLPPAPRPAPAAIIPPLSLKPVPVPVDGIDEQQPIFNASAAEAAQHGMLLAPCTVLPKAAVVGRHFILTVQAAFIEQPASITTYSRQIKVDDAHVLGPRLVLAYAPSSRLGELGIDWDLEVVTPGRNLARLVEGKEHILVFHLPAAYIHHPFTLRLKVRGNQNIWEEQLLQVTPRSPNSM